MRLYQAPIEPMFIDTLTMSAHWLPALINDDYSGLSDNDCQNLDTWFKEYKDIGACYIFEVKSDNTDNFTTDCVSGLFADCHVINVFEV